MLLLQHSCCSLSKRQKVCDSLGDAINSGLLQGAFRRWNMKRFYLGVLRRPLCSFYLSTFAGSLGALTAGLTLGTITQSTRLWFLYKALTGITDILQIHVRPLLGEFVPSWKGLIEWVFGAFVIKLTKYSQVPHFFSLCGTSAKYKLF